MFAGLKGGFLSKKIKSNKRKNKNSGKSKKQDGTESTKHKVAQPPHALESTDDVEAAAAAAAAAAALSKVLQLISRNEVEFDGITKKILFNENEFQKAMYPLDSKASIEKKGLPTSFQKLISSEKWRQQLLRIMPQVCMKAESIEAGVRARAAKSGQPLDIHSATVLRPQILLEAFGRGVIKMMHAYGREQHVQMSRSVKHLASVESGTYKHY